MTFFTFLLSHQPGCKTYDAGKGDSGWKEQFHLTRIPQYMLTINR